MSKSKTIKKSDQTIFSNNMSKPEAKPKSKMADTYEITLPESLSSYLTPISIFIGSLMISLSIIFGGNTEGFSLTKTFEEDPSLSGVERIYAYADFVGVNKDKLITCTENEETLAEVEKSIEEGSESGISGTPGFVIGEVKDGKVIGTGIGGAYPYESFERALNAYIEEDQDFINMVEQIRTSNQSLEKEKLESLSNSLANFSDYAPFASLKETIDQYLSLLNNPETPQEDLTSLGANLQYDLKLAATETTIGDGAKLGKENSKVAIVEYSDYECPYCQRHATQVGNKIQENFVEKNKVLWVFKDFPLSFHNPVATEEAVALRCVLKLSDDEKYFKLHDYVFENTQTNGAGLK